MTVYSTRILRALICTIAIALAAVAGLEVRGQAPAGPCICSPLLMNIEGEPWQESVQNWDFVADGSGSFRLKFFTHTVNPDEQGSLGVAILNDAEQVITETTVPFQWGAGVSGGAENSVDFMFGATAGQQFRLRVTNPPAVGAIPRAHHYRFEAHGAASASQESPGIRLQEGVVPQRWMVKVAPGEDFDLQVLPGFPGAGGDTPEAQVRLLDPSGAVWYADPASAPLPRIFMIPNAAGGEWTLDFVSAHAHFTLDKLSGPDRRLYLTPFSAGRGQIDVSVEPFGRPLSLSITNTTTGQTFPAGPGLWPLDVGRYTVVANGDNVTPRSVIVDVPCNGRIPLTFQVLNRPPSVTIPGEPFTMQAGGWINLNAWASDPDGDQLSYEWTRVSGGGSIGEMHMPGTTYTASEPTVATVQVVVRDPFGGTATATATITVTPAPHYWAATYNVAFIAPAISGDAAMDGVYPFTYSWNFGLFNQDATRVIDAPRITVSTALGGLTTRAEPDVTLDPHYPPYVWRTGQLQPRGPGRSWMFAGLNSNIIVAGEQRLGFDVTRSPAALVAGGASTMQMFTYTMTSRDASLTGLTVDVNFWAASPGTNTVSASDINCSSTTGEMAPAGPSGARWTLSTPNHQPLPVGVQHMITCHATLTNPSPTAAYYTPQVIANGMRAVESAPVPGSSTTVSSDASLPDPLGTVQYDVTNVTEPRVHVVREFNRTAFLNGRNQAVNRPPSVHIMGGPFTTTAGAPPIMIEAMGTDPDPGDWLTYQWEIVSGGGNLWNAGSPMANYSSPTPTFATLRVTVRDREGETATATTTVNVLAPPKPAHKWHADYTMEWIAPRTTADQVMNGPSPFTYTWRFGILNDPVDVIDAPRIGVGTSLSGLSPSQQWLTLNPPPPPYVWSGPQLAPAGQGNSQMFTSLWSSLAVPQPYDLGFDATRNVGGPVAASATELRTLTFTMTPRDAALTQLAAHVNFGDVAPGVPGPVVVANANCTSASGFTQPFTNPDGSWGVRWQINYETTTQPLTPGETHTMTCSVTLTNSAASPVEWAPYMMASGKRTSPMVVSNGGSVTFASDPVNAPWDPLGTVTYDITAPPGELVAQFTKHFSRLVNLDGRNRVLDVTPPVTTATYPGANDFGWYTYNVNVSLNAVDSGSGVRHIKYSLNGAPTAMVMGSSANVWISAEGENTLTFWAEDNAGNVEAAKSITLRIDKTRPVVTVASPLSTPEGSTLLIPFSATDASGEALTYQCVVVRGMGTATIVGPNSCAYQAGDGPASARVVIRAFDGRGNVGGAGTDIAITDAPPQIISITGPTAPLRVGTAATIDVTYTDPVLDAVTCTFDWEDGSEPTTTAGANNACAATHTYTTPGVYTVGVTVMDDDGGASHGTFDYVVVYNPDAGWVTGGGWIGSPAGALSSNGTLTGRANFGFNARYNGDVAQGQTEFQFQNGRLNFHSASYDWLVVMDGFAAYMGNGTINGSGNYKFVVIVTDEKAGGTPEDRFRIRIWNDATGEVIYDSEPGIELELPATPLSGGNITIHK